MFLKNRIIIAAKNVFYKIHFVLIKIHFVLIKIHFVLFKVHFDFPRQLFYVIISEKNGI